MHCSATTIQNRFALHGWVSDSHSRIAVPISELHRVHSHSRRILVGKRELRIPIPDGCRPLIRSQKFKGPFHQRQLTLTVGFRRTLTSS